MAVLLWSFLSLAIATAIHIVWWRVSPPRRHSRALLLVYVVVLALVVPLAYACGTSWWECGQVGLMVISATLAYIISYSAVEADSPTLVIIQAIQAAGDQGVSQSNLHQQLNDDVLVMPRIADLVRDKMLRDSHGSLSMTPKGLGFVSLLRFYRGLIGAGRGG